jgi:hypothetical protein
MKKCKLCGKEFEIIDKGWTREYCYDCSPSYSRDGKHSHSDNITAKRRAIKKHLIERAGGKCVKCGYDKCQAALQFHHLDPNQKDFTISHDFSHDVKKLYSEVDKCILVCANCHAEIHHELED